MSPGPNVVRCALTQTVSCYPHVPVAGRLGEVRRANVERHIELLGVAARLGAHVVCFGELFTAPYFALREDAMWRDLAEDAERGPTVTELRHAARAQRALVVAPIYELDPSGRRFNTAVVIDEEGEILGKYRKTHIPHGQNEQAAFLEGFYYERSDGQNGRGLANVSRNDYFPVFQTSVARIGVAICYDRHFEGVMSSLAAEGAEIVFSPAVTFGDKSRRMWPLEFEVDAARHRLYIGGSNRKGIEPPWGQEYFGDSRFVGPQGVLPDVSTDPALVVADLDLDVLAAPDPSGWDLRRDARAGIYSRPGAKGRR